MGIWSKKSFSGVELEYSPISSHITGKISFYTRDQHADAGPNRHPALWGPDADIFRPERWLEMKGNKIKLGVYDNLYVTRISAYMIITFSSRGGFGAGTHSCIGWRFASVFFHPSCGGGTDVFLEFMSSNLSISNY